MRSAFDWKGFFFAARLIVIGCVLLGSAQLGWAYAESRYEADLAAQKPALAEPVPAGDPITVFMFSTSTPDRVVSMLKPEDVIPETGKFIEANLRDMVVTLYQDGIASSTFPIRTKGKPGTPWETPSGFYAIQTKEENHFSSIGKVYMPYSMQFYGNYFIHGWTTYPDGTPTPFTFSGGCIKLDTDDAAQVYAFADVGTKLFVYDPPVSAPLPALTLEKPAPKVGAGSYLVADIDTGDVYAESGAHEERPIASVTKLMTALVANETISFDKKLSVPEGVLTNPRDPAKTRPRQFVIGDLLYPLLMQSSNHVADILAQYYGTSNFVAWMNTAARALGMEHTRFADPSGLSPENTSTAEDLFRLAAYIEHKKSFILRLTKTPDKTIVASDGSRYAVKNVNEPANKPPFDGGKIGYTDEALDTMVSVVALPGANGTHRIAVIVLGSTDQSADTTHLAKWLLASAKESSQTACATCAAPGNYRTISF